MFLNSLSIYIVIPVIAVVIAQYAFALFCLTKLAYLDISRKNYVLWNVFILIVFFIGGIVFLVYYYKHPEKLIDKSPKGTTVEPNAPNENADAATDADDVADEHAAEDNNNDDTD